MPTSQEEPDEASEAWPPPVSDRPYVVQRYAGISARIKPDTLELSGASYAGRAAITLLVSTLLLLILYPLGIALTLVPGTPPRQWLSAAVQVLVQFPVLTVMLGVMAIIVVVAGLLTLQRIEAREWIRIERSAKEYRDAAGRQRSLDGLLAVGVFRMGGLYRVRFVPQPSRSLYTAYRMRTRYASWVFGRDRESALAVAGLLSEYTGLPLFVQNSAVNRS